MTEKDWLLLQIISEENNITKASERLFISQPALTYRIRQIEKDFNVKIVSRSKKGIRLTTEGEYLVQYAKKMIQELRKTRDALLNISGNLQGTLRIGAASNFAQYKLPSILREFLTLHPNVQTRVSTGKSHDILDLLNDGKIDIGIIRGGHPWHGEKILLDEDTISMIYKEKIDFEKFPYLPRISYKTDPLLILEIDKWWNECFTTPPLTIMEVDKVETCKEMVINGLGCAIVPSVYLKPTDHLYAQPICDKNGKTILRQTWMIYRSTDTELKIVSAFIRFIKNHILPDTKGESASRVS